MNAKPSEIVRLAQTWCFGWEFCPPSHIVVELGRPHGGFWFPPTGDKPAWISIGHEDGFDLLYHEVFHGVVHKSPFGKSSEGWWTEGFCNAFSEFARNEFYPFSREKMVRDSQHHREYLGACLALREHVVGCGWDPFEELRNLWHYANAGRLSADQFSKLVGYNPKTGEFTPA